MTRFGQILFVAIFTMMVLGFSVKECAAESDNIITGCNEGAYERHRQAFPRQSIGNAPNKFLRWFVHLEKGNYTIQVLSPYDFDHAVFYRKGDGKDTRIGIPPSRRINHQGKTYYTISFRANHFDSVWNNRWHIEIKPKGQAQNVDHPVQLSIKHENCPQAKGTNCHCPPGSTPVTSTTWGQTECFLNGKIVPQICE